MDRSFATLSRTDVSIVIVLMMDIVAANAPVGEAFSAAAQLPCVPFSTLHGGCKIPAVAPTLDMPALGSLAHFYTKLKRAPNFSLCGIYTVWGRYFLPFSRGGGRRLLTADFLRRSDTQGVGCCDDLAAPPRAATASLNQSQQHFSVECL